MGSPVTRLLTRGALLLVVIAFTVLGIRAWDSQRGPRLERWHTYVPRELTADEIARADWATYLAAENRLFDDVRAEVTEKLDPEARNPANRYFDGSPLYPGRFATDWNRSFILEPAAPAVGAVVFLHGLTDSPYSSRYLARSYREHGYVVVSIRLPAHGTVPGALTDVEWEDWSAATRLAVREARRRVGPSAPLHLVGYSNGGALAVQYALDAIGDPTLTRPDRIVLISPMIGVTRLARFAGLVGLPALLPAFAKAAWLSVVPEFNPFKYNSFPVNGARQSSRLARALQRQIARDARENRLGDLPPVLTFQSVVDFTVSARAIVSALYVHLPANGSELVLFDVNRSAKFGPLLRPSADTGLARLLPDPPRSFRTTVITNIGPDRRDVVENVTEAGEMTARWRELGLAYPFGVFSLSHIALPFPISDALYGTDPTGDEDFGVNLGSMAVRGERGTLIVDQDFLTRMSSNPFFPYMLERIEEGTRDRPARRAATSERTAGERRR
jgi:alpha-beta hydrolase superfamily lysophospholipase